jgi:hypothetical protein
MEVAMKKKWFAIPFGFVFGCLLILGFGVNSLGVVHESEGLICASLSELPGWLHSKSHEIWGTTTGAQTNYTMMFNVYFGSGTDSGSDVYLDGNC